MNNDTKELLATVGKKAGFEMLSLAGKHITSLAQILLTKEEQKAKMELKSDKLSKLSKAERDSLENVGPYEIGVGRFDHND